MEHGNLREVFIADYEHYLAINENDPLFGPHLRAARTVKEVVEKRPWLDELMIIRLYAEILDVCSNQEDWAFDYGINFVDIYIKN